jgi:thiamine biosynthesis protein ThiS
MRMKQACWSGSTKKHMSYNSWTHSERRDRTLTHITPPFAAAVNAQFVPKTLYAQTLLQDNDKIELIVPITGG